MLLTSGLAASKRRRDGAVPSTGDGGRRQCGSSCTFGKTTTQVGWPTTISLVNRPNGSPVRTRRAPSRYEPRRSSVTLASHCRLPRDGDPDHPARQRRRQGRVVPQLHPRLAPAGLVVDAVDGLQHLAHLGARVQHVVAGAQPLQAAPRVAATRPAGGRRAGRPGRRGSRMPVLKAATTSTVPRKTNRSCFARLPMWRGPRYGMRARPDPPWRCSPRRSAPGPGSRARSNRDRSRAARPGS